MSLNISTITNIGLRRGKNCDHVLVKKMPLGRLFLLADGHTIREGDEMDAYLAASLCCENVFNEMNTNEFGDIRARFEKAVMGANEFLRNNNIEFSEFTSGTTLVAGLIVRETLLFVSIGDSRIYSILNGRISQLTEDEVDTQGRLLQSIGRSEKIKVDVSTKILFPGEKLLFCSDGLYKMVSDEEILEIVCGQQDLNRKTRTLMMTANKNGGEDNISAILVEFYGNN